MSKQLIDNYLRKNIIIGRGAMPLSAKAIYAKKVIKGRYGSKRTTQHLNVKKPIKGSGRTKGPLAIYVDKLDKLFKKRYEGRNKSISLEDVKKIARFQMKKGISPSEAAKKGYHITSTGRIAIGTLAQASRKNVPMYCGVSSVPPGKRRGTPEYCLKTKQIRYYGRKAVDKKILGPKKKVSTVQDEMVKLHALVSRAKILVRNAKHLNIIISHAKSTQQEINKAEKKMIMLRKQRDKLRKALEQQEKIVKNMSKMIKK